MQLLCSKASKRRAAMKALGWWHVNKELSDKSHAAGKDVDDSSSNTCMEGPDSGLTPEQQGILFSHTMYRQVDESTGAGAQAFLCASKHTEEGCPCCVGLPNADRLEATLFNVQREQTSDALEPIPHDAKHMLEALPGCGVHFDGGWNEFWD